MKHLRHIIIVAANIFLLTAGLFAQDSLANKYTDISEVKFQKTITRFISSAYISKNEDPEQAMQMLNLFRV